MIIMAKPIYICFFLIFNLYTLSQAGDIKGRVVIPMNPPQEKTGGLSSLYTKPSQHSAHLAAQTTSSNTVLFIKEFPNQPDPKPVEGAELMQKNQMFIPHIMVVPVGTTVEFPNADNVYHNVFSFSKTKTFDLGRYAQGKSKSVKFDKPGMVDVFCEIHSDMRAYVIVVPNEFYTTAGSNGEFIIRNVPPGKHVIAAWHKSFAVKEYNITVPESGEIEININF